MNFKIDTDLSLEGTDTNYNQDRSNDVYFDDTEKDYEDTADGWSYYFNFKL